MGLRVQGHGFGRTSIVTLMAIAATTVPVIISSVALKDFLYYSYDCYCRLFFLASYYNCNYDDYSVVFSTVLILTVVIFLKGAKRLTPKPEP